VLKTTPQTKITSPVLSIRNIQKRFGSQTALESVNLEIKKGEFFSLLGPSGCGKSTLLRILAGLEEATEGEIWWNGERIDGLPARERPFNMVFQKYALFPHLSVFDNVAFGLNLKRLTREETKTRVTEALHLVNLNGYEHRLPETLSGGQAQRVALARALVNRPACVLLDEPLTALDQKLREHMQTELRLLQKSLGLTFIFVTHDQEEAMLMSDRVAVMNAGRIEQVSAPRELYEAPASIFCARFIGRRNELAVDAFGSGVQLRGRSPSSSAPRALQRGSRIFVRPERVKVRAIGAPAVSGWNTLEGEVIQVLFRGVHSEIILSLGGSLFIRAFSEAAPDQFKAGDRAILEFDPEDAHVFSEEDAT
jgi:spermidine/putrescine transport system ATP-binding protein